MDQLESTVQSGLQNGPIRIHVTSICSFKTWI